MEASHILNMEAKIYFLLVITCRKKRIEVNISGKFL